MEGGVVGLAENIATQPNLAGAWAELGDELSRVGVGGWIKGD